MNHFIVTELSTGNDLYVQTLRRRAQNQNLWRKGAVDAIIEEYKKKWKNREDKRTRYNPAAASKRRRTPRTPRSRTPARTSTSARTTEHITVFWTHAITKLEWKKGNLSLCSINMPLL
jgi:hypothetical protein